MTRGADAGRIADPSCDTVRWTVGIWSPCGANPGVKSPNRHVLIIDDEQAVCWALEQALIKEGHAAAVAASAEQAFVLIARQTPDVILLDVRLPGMDGLTALPRVRELAPDAAVIVMTAFGSLPTAVKAVEGGAFDYLAKPFDLEQALAAVRRALARRSPPALTEEDHWREQPGGEEMVGISAAMQEVFKRIALVAPHDSSVLITGESGTGKELVARAIHRYSSRRDRPFIAVNIGALSPNLIESELFGHLRGSFTGATVTRPGVLEKADGGTLFMDEIGEMPLAVQVKLLRVLETREIVPVGSTQPVPLNLRILSATNQDLPRAVAEGRFRQDLFFRLNVFEIHLPPLRERLEDVEVLATHFLSRFKPSALPLPAETLRFLKSQVWFGNVRELRNALERATIMARDEPLWPEHFPRLSGYHPSPTSPADDLTADVRKWLAEQVKASPEGPRDLYEALLKVVEPALLEDVMRRLKGNRWVAAQWLGLNRATVRKKLGLYGLADVDGEDEPEA